MKLDRASWPDNHAVGYNYSFNHWMEWLRVYVKETTDIDPGNLPDRPYRTWFNSGLTPKDAVKRILTTIQMTG